MNLLLESLSTVELYRFWASSKNKKELHILSYVSKRRPKKRNLPLLLSRYVTERGGVQDCAVFKDRRIITEEKLKSSIEEGDCCFVQHIESVQSESQRVAVISSDTDVVVYCLANDNWYQFYGYKEVWVRF